MSLTIDIIEGASWDHAVAGSTYVRIAFVGGLDAGTLHGDPSMLFRALAEAGLPQWYDTHPNAPSYTCNRHVITPIGDSAAQIAIYYVTGPGHPPASTWVVTESTTPMQLTTQIHPGTLQPMTTTFTSANGVTLTDVATFTYDISLRRITFEGFVDRTSAGGTSTSTAPANTDAFSNAVNTVNDSPWRNLGTGFWKMDEWMDNTQDRGFSYTLRAGFATKIIEDWSSYSVLRDPNTGKLVAPTPADVTALRNTPYLYGFTSKNGISKAGLYPTSNIAQLFGP